eukprot:TRINITY_DN11415_c0_g1_i1.p1 TRINITY_DN11415_c0_g1~~TRINITY_DN11415_c0_g1_i1.p1  ORF type:complete len:141 (+),score=25.76 TRINITY_DN11415_c0_g1_i1:3-425(+)
MQNNNNINNNNSFSNHPQQQSSHFYNPNNVHQQNINILPVNNNNFQQNQNYNNFDQEQFIKLSNLLTQVFSDDLEIRNKINNIIQKNPDIVHNVYNDLIEETDFKFLKFYFNMMVLPNLGTDAISFDSFRTIILVSFKSF